MNIDDRFFNIFKSLGLLEMVHLLSIFLCRILSYLNSLTVIFVPFHVFIDLSGLTLSSSGEKVPKFLFVLVGDFIDVQQTDLSAVLM